MADADAPVEGRRRWDAAQYLRFGDERTRAAGELLARVPLPLAKGGTGLAMVDLGCGPGNSTALLRARWPEANLLGVDHAPAMLARARSEYPDIAFEEGDLVSWSPRAPLDLVFANAVFHWLPDHTTLFPRVFSWLRPGGVLAVQMPSNAEEPSHRRMRELPGPWTSALREVAAATPVQAPAFYYDLVAREAAAVDLWQTRYEHVMDSAADIVAWVRGAGLRPYLDALSPSMQTGYLEAYERAIDDAYPARADGRRLFSFPRLFLVAVRRDDPPANR